MGTSPKQFGGIFATENSLSHAGTATADPPATGLPEGVTPDFSGWATKANLRCSDGRTIMPDAFKHQDKMQVPLVWQHAHDEPGNVLGHAILENRDDGVYCYGFFNDTKSGEDAKKLVAHKDVSGLSIFANKLIEKAKQVSHGMIREVSLVMAGANPGAFIDNIMIQHADGTDVQLDDEAVIYTGLALEHADGSSSDDGGDDDQGDTVQDIYDSMSPEQKQVCAHMVSVALEEAKPEDGSAQHSALPAKPGVGGNNDDGKEVRHMTRNVFEQQKGSGAEGEPQGHELSHDDLKQIAADARRLGSAKMAIDAYALAHGIESIDILFPDAKTVTNTPEFDKRRTEWVSAVINGTKHAPFSRIKSVTADLTHEEARARGYIKGNFKKEEYFGLAKRVTTPSTIYKKQKLDRDDIIDITDMDVVAWLKGEMRLMLDEEYARAILIGDGRAVDDEDKVKDPAGSNEGAGIRSILHDHELYAATVTVDDGSTPQQLVDKILENMRFYKGSGTPTLYTTLPNLTKMLLARDGMGRRLYRTAAELAAELTVDKIVTVEVLEQEPTLFGIIVNLVDYTVGTDRGGEVSMFDDFDIDYNQYKYLIETRLSGALTKIRSALVVRTSDAGDTLVVPAPPLFDEETGDVVIDDTAGVVYRRADTNAVVTSASVINVAEGDSLKITSEADATHYFENNVEDEWTFTREA